MSARLRTQPGRKCQNGNRSRHQFCFSVLFGRGKKVSDLLDLPTREELCGKRSWNGHGKLCPPGKSTKWVFPPKLFNFGGKEASRLPGCAVFCLVKAVSCSERRPNCNHFFHFCKRLRLDTLRTPVTFLSTPEDQRLNLSSVH